MRSPRFAPPPRLSPPQDDLVCLPSKVASSLGHMGPIVVVTKMSNQITLLDPNTLRTATMDVSRGPGVTFTAGVARRKETV